MDKQSYFYIGQLAYLTLFLAFSAPRLRWLRSVALLSSLGFIWFHYSAGPEPLWIPIAWNFLFAAANTCHLYRTRKGENVVPLSPLEEFLHKTALANFPARELKSFVAVGNEGELPAEKQMIRAGAELEYLFCLLQGGVRVSRYGKNIAELAPGSFVGEMSLLTKDLTRADVFTTTDSRFLVWKHSDIDTWVGKDHSRLSLLQVALGAQVVEQLLRQNDQVVESLKEVA